MHVKIYQKPSFIFSTFTYVPFFLGVRFPAVARPHEIRGKSMYARMAFSEFIHTLPTSERVFRVCVCVCGVGRCILLINQ